jgi:hypothetical protein
MLTNTVFFIASLLAAGNSTAPPQPSVTVTKQDRITDHETSGNLESLNPVNCVPIAALSRTNTPADLLAGANKCADKADYESAVTLYSVAGAYGIFDTLRVRDQSALEALEVLRLNFANSLNERQKAAFGQAIQHALSDAKTHAALCTSLEELGPPDYFPTYMVQHGMNAFAGGTPGGELEKDFDAPKAWVTALDAAARCKAGA